MGRTRAALIVAISTGALAPLQVHAQFTTGQFPIAVIGQDRPDAWLPLTSGQALSRPTAVAVDPVSGHVYVADTDHHRVLRFTSYAILETGGSAEAAFGQPDLFDSRAGTSRTRMVSPRGVAVDSQGRLYVADFGNGRVLRFDDASAKPTGAPADGVLGEKDFTTSNSVISFADAIWRTHTPSSLVVDAQGSLFVTDGSFNRVLRFDNAASKPNGANADGVLGQADFTSGFLSNAPPSRSRMSDPSGLALDADGRLFVADSGFRRVLRFDNAARRANGAPADGVLGQPSYTSTEMGTTAATFGFSFGLAVDGRGRLYLSDYNAHRVLRFDDAASKANGASADGVIGQTSFTSWQVSPAQRTSLREPRGIATDAEGRLWIADSFNNRLLRFDTPFGATSGPAADGVTGQISYERTLVLLSSRRLFPVAGIAVDPTSGKVFVADIFGRILRFPSDAAYRNGAEPDGVLGHSDYSGTPAPTGATFQTISALAVGEDGRLYVADEATNRVAWFNRASSAENGALPDGVLGWQQVTNRGTPTYELVLPSGLAVSRDGGHLFVAERGGHRVVRFDNPAALANGAAPQGVLGQPGFATRSSGRTQTTMNQPRHLAIGRDGALYVADSGNLRVLRFNAAASAPNGAPADGVIGQDGFTQAASTPVQTRFHEPHSVAVDETGGVYVTDRFRHRVFLYTAAAEKVNGAPPDVVIGQENFTTTGSVSGVPNRLWSPSALALDLRRGLLLVSDEGNRRVQVFQSSRPLPASNAPSARGALRLEPRARGEVLLAAPAQEPVRVDVFDLVGRRVRTLYESYGEAAAVLLTLPPDLAVGAYVVRAESPTGSASVVVIR